MTFSSQIEKEAGPQAGLFAGVQLELLLESELPTLQNLL